jgi:glycosyltransferase involved in cell wall biosynthesis
MRLCVVSFKECWQDDDQKWVSSGGFPAQMAALGTLFDELTLVIVRGRPQPGGIPLPEYARIVPLRSPVGADTRRKISIAANAIYYLRSIAQQLRDADVVHTPVPGDIPFLGMILASALRKRVFAMYNASWTTNPQTSWMDRVTRRFMRALARGNNVMVALGPVGIETVPAPRMHWIFVTTIAEDEMRTVRPALERTPHAPLRFAYVGRLSPEKGLLGLLRAMSSLRADPTLARSVPQLTLMGDGPQRADLLAETKRLRCEDIVHFAGQLDRSALVQHLLSTDVCVLPSLSEGFCKARLDAMLCGVPVITTDVGFGREIVGSDGERGWVVPPGDVPALAAALRRVVTERLDWPSLRLRCRTYVEGQTLDAWAGRIGELCARQWNLSIVDRKLRN